MFKENINSAQIVTDQRLDLICYQRRLLGRFQMFSLMRLKGCRKKLISKAIPMKAQVNKLTIKMKFLGIIMQCDLNETR